MKFRRSIFAGAVLALSSVAFTAQAQVIDFDGFGLTNLNNSSVAEDGFNITHSGSFAQIFPNAGQGATDFSGNGTARLVSFNTSSISLTSASSSLFGLSRFDGGESWIQAGQAHRWATQIQVVGTYADNSTTVQVFNLDLVKSPLLGMETFTLNNSFAGGLKKVVFTGIGGNPEFSLDNIAVAAVPEPETYALLLAGLGLMGTVARRRRAARG